MPKKGEMTFHVGGEYVAMKILALRAGYNGRIDADRGITIGGGILLGQLSMDYAFVPFGDLGVSHRLSMLLRWGGVDKRPSASYTRSEVPSDPVKERFVRAGMLIEAKNYTEAKKELAAASALLGPEDHRRIRYYERMGTVALGERELDKAKGYYLEALNLGRTRGITDSSMAEVYAGMGACLAAQKNSEYAIRYLSKALEFEPVPETRRMIQDQLRQLETAGR